MLAWIAPGFAAAALASLALLAPPAGAEGRLQKLRGHLGVGYAKLFSDPAPGGSFSMAAGVDYPVAASWKAGVALGYELLGGQVVERGSQVASVDYSMLEMLALAHWESPRLGPVCRISFGPGLFSPRADLATSAGGASFSDLAVDGVVPGIALGGTLMRRRDSPVRIGLEVGLRIVFLEGETWNLALASLAFHY